MSQKIILASSSKYRKQLLEKICTHFDCISPDIDESRKSNESVISMVERLAQEKARAVESTLANNESALVQIKQPILKVNLLGNLAHIMQL